MLILVAPLNWGLGHASRCIPLIHRFLDEGHDVMLGGDGESLTLLKQHFPQLPVLCLAPLNIRYSRSPRQTWAVLRALPQLLRNAIQDHYILKDCLRTTPIDKVISDNRFGLYSPQTHCVYITHQIHIRLPRTWRWAEPIVNALHARTYNRYNELWIPDHEDPSCSLAGDLSHPAPTTPQTQYIGPLSRFSLPIQTAAADLQADVVAVLSGLEPQRTIIEQQLIQRFADSQEQVLIIQGLVNRPKTRIHRRNTTIIPHLPDSELLPILQQAHTIIARSGYSTIMDLHTLGMLPKAELIPTPGQPEQEYLATHIKHFITNSIINN